MGLYILIFQLLIIIIYGIFVRTGTSTSVATGTEGPMYFTLAFTLANLRGRMFDWSHLTNYLFICALAFQTNTLYLMLWDSAFNSGFSSTTTITSNYLLINIQCILALLVTAYQFTGKLTLQQIFALTMVQIFAFALNFSICQFGVKAISGGGTITIFLFGYVFALPIKKFCCDQELEIQAQQKQRYFTLTLKIIGAVALIILWPNFSSTTASIDASYLSTSITTPALLATQGFIHTFLAFCSAIGTTIGLRIMGQKIILEKFVNYLVITGMFIGSSSLVIIDPFASLLMGMVCPIILFVLDKYASFILLKGYSIDAVIMCFLGGLFDAIFAGGRNGRTPQLSTNATKQGGLQFAAVLVTIIFAVLFGFLATVILRCFNPRQSINKDNMLWFVDQQSLPIYKDDEILKKIIGQNNTQMLKNENAFLNLKQSFITEQERQNLDQGKILRQNIE